MWWWWWWCCNTELLCSAVLDDERAGGVKAAASQEVAEFEPVDKTVTTVPEVEQVEHLANVCPRTTIHGVHFTDEWKDAAGPSTLTPHFSSVFTKYNVDISRRTVTYRNSQSQLSLLPSVGQKMSTGHIHATCVRGGVLETSTTDLASLCGQYLSLYTVMVEIQRQERKYQNKFKSKEEKKKNLTRHRLHNYENCPFPALIPKWSSLLTRRNLPTIYGIYGGSCYFEIQKRARYHWRCTKENFNCFSREKHHPSPYPTFSGKGRLSPKPAPSRSWPAATRFCLVSTHTL